MLSEKAKQVWKSGVWSAFPNWDEWRADPDTVSLIPLWPEFRPVEFLLEQKISMDDDLAFAQEYLCKVVDDDAQVFNRHLIRKNIDIDSVGGFNVQLDGSSRFIIGFDPAHGIGKDYSVLICLRQDEQGYVHFVDMWRKNDFPPDKQADVIIKWAKHFKAPVAAEDVGFQRLYETVIEQKGGHIEYRQSKASNKGLKQGLMNRLRVWFERELIVFPFGSDDIRKKVGIILDELENHVWKGGDIIDVGKHNDTVMALAHAIDQFKPKTNNALPMATGTTGGWNKSKINPKSKNIRRGRPSNSKYVGFL
tara:strand:- start:243 stop:1163 length:921 start_codon:yes stop_codon:yes gene_type:complete